MTVVLGLRRNIGQFALLVAVNALVGAMVGQERTVLPLLAEQVFGLVGASAALTFLVAFGISKAFANLAAGALADRYGRRPVLIAGWLIGIPVPIIIIVAPDWSWIVAANVLLGINQGLTWSTTVIMKIDLVGPTRRGLALGLNEASGYLAVAGAALLTGVIAADAGLRPHRSCSGSRSPDSASGCPRRWSARPGRTWLSSRPPWMAGRSAHRGSRSCAGHRGPIGVSWRHRRPGW